MSVAASILVGSSSQEVVVMALVNTKGSGPVWPSSLRGRRRAYIARCPHSLLELLQDRLGPDAFKNSLRLGGC